MKKIMLIGYGAMAQAVIERLPPQVTLGWIVAREAHHAAIRARFGDAVTVLDDPQSCTEAPDLVLECASQQAVAQYGEAILARGWHLAVISTGALADSALEQRLYQAGGRLTLLAGAEATRKCSSTSMRSAKRKSFLRAAPAKRHACFRRMPTWRQPWRWAVSAWTTRGCS